MFQEIKQYLVKISGFWFYNVKKLPAGTHLEYFLKYRVKMEFKLIFDVGANIGKFSGNLNRFFPDSEFYCFEPIGSTFRKLEESLKSNQFHLIQKALGEKQEYITIKTNEDNRSDENSLLAKNQPIDSKKEEILEVVTLDSFLQNSPISQIDFLKVDTEGYDLFVLKGARENLESGKIKFIYVECGLDTSNKYHVHLSEFIEYLSEFDYCLLGIYQTDLRKVSKKMHFSNALFCHHSVSNLIKK